LSGPAPVIVWFRRDLRLSDHPALAAAVATGQPVLPLFIHDETVETLGAAPRFRLGLSVGALAADLAAQGSRLILRRGRALDVLAALAAETGATAIHWSRYYAPDHIARDRAVKDWAAGAGIAARSYAGALLHEPSRLLTGAGRPYSVFTPFRRRLAASDIEPPLPAPGRLQPPGDWPDGDRLDDWRMARAMNRAAEVVAAHLSVGEAAARDRLGLFLQDRAGRYAEDRDRTDRDATSGLSENLAWGEISPRQIWHLTTALSGTGEKFLSELAWRDFAWHLMAHFPDLASRSWRAGWDRFPWRADSDRAEAWRRGRTGVELVDAGMRELYVTGRMHNRVRMVVASYLTKHLLTDWRIGLRWFQDCLVDWDPAANAMNWQWVAGSGPDAAPFFRIFNPDTQAERFDPDGLYRRRWLAHAARPPAPDALSFFAAIPRSWRMDPADPPPRPVEPLAAGRAQALAAFEALNTVM
jgi:deoxyribodipyrimidine photo-lyase